MFQSKDEHEIWTAGEPGNGGMRRPRSGRLPFFGFWFDTRTVIIIACAAWKSGKPVFGFPRARHFHGPLPAMISAERGRYRMWPLALPEQACFGSLHPASPFGVAPLVG